MFPLTVWKRRMSWARRGCVLILKGTVACSRIKRACGGWDLLTPSHLWLLLEGNHALMGKGGLTPAQKRGSLLFSRKRQIGCALWTTAQDTSPEPLLFAVLLRPQSAEAVCFLLGGGKTAIPLPSVRVLLYDSAYLMRQVGLCKYDQTCVDQCASPLREGRGEVNASGHVISSHLQPHFSLSPPSP